MNSPAADPRTKECNGLATCWAPAHLQGCRARPAVNDAVNHPAHYTSHPSGVEVITITEHMGFCLGNAVKCILRADLKGNALEDLRKAIWYIDREIQKRER